MVFAPFIVFEGIDGSGKTTQIDMLEKWLADKVGVERLRLREPGGTAVGERVREILKDKSLISMTPKAELMLFMAARQQLVDERIEPARWAGKIVILDRYYFSTMAYQGAAGKLGVSTVRMLAEDFLHLPKPDLVILLDVDVDTASARRGKEFQDRIEAKGLDYQKNVRVAFIEMSTKYSNFAVVDASRSADAVHLDVVRSVRPFLERS